MSFEVSPIETPETLPSNKGFIPLGNTPLIAPMIVTSNPGGTSTLASVTEDRVFVGLALSRVSVFRPPATLIGAGIFAYTRPVTVFTRVRLLLLVTLRWIFVIARIP
jgi:hypothetical protein